MTHPKPKKPKKPLCYGTFPSCGLLKSLLCPWREGCMALRREHEECLSPEEKMEFIKLLRVLKRGKEANDEDRED